MRTSIRACAALAIAVCICCVQGKSLSPRELRFAVVLARHGLRSPTWTVEQLNQYSAKPWPHWNVPPGDLTPHGKEEMTLLGAYDREYFSQAGLLQTSDCKMAHSVHIHADIDQRTIESARGLAAGLLPGCAIEVEVQPDGKVDPLFSPIKAGIGKFDRQEAAAAVSGRIGGDPEALIDGYRSAFDTMQAILQDCETFPKCPAKAASKSLLDTPASVKPGTGDQLVDMTGPLSTGSTLSEDFLLEYGNGMDTGSLGWGRLNAANLIQIMAIHTGYADLARRTPYIARANGSNLMSHILTALSKAVEGSSDRLWILLGHDTNISNLSGMLELSWLIPGYQRDDTPPGGSLVFELWCAPESRDCTVHTYYTSQTPLQMREGQKLTLSSPPPRSNVFVPGCSSSLEDHACSWESFRRTVESRMDPAFIR